MKFPYPWRLLALRTAAYIGLLACLLYIMHLGGVAQVWLAGFGGLFLAAIVITQVSPMFTAHSIGPGWITLRHGLVFRAVLPAEAVASVEHFRGAGILGPGRARGRVVLATGSSRLVMVRLRQARRFGTLLFRRCTEFVIDLDDPEGFVRTAGSMLEHASAAPEV